MKRLAFRILIGFLTFSFGVGMVSVLISRYKHRLRPPLGLTAAALGALAGEGEPIHTKLEKVADLPEQMKDEGYSSIQFVNRRDGWLELNNALWRTKNGGEDWEQVFSGEFGDDAVMRIGTIKFINAQVGWMVASFNLYRTADGGATWQVIAQPIRHANGDYPPVGIRDVFMLKDGKHGWILGDQCRKLTRKESKDGGFPTRFSSYDEKRVSSSLIYYTSDGGNSWTRETIAFTFLEDIYEIYAIDTEHAWAAGQAGTYYLQAGKWLPVKYDTVGGGEQTEVSCLEHYYGAPTDEPDNFFFINPRMGWIANTNGYIGITRDGGRNWQDLSSQLGGSGQGGGFWQTTRGLDLNFSDVKRGWGIDGDGYLRRSQDGGATWTLVDTTMTLNAMFFLDADHGWVVSDQGIFRIP